VLNFKKNLRVSIPPASFSTRYKDGLYAELDAQGSLAHLGSYANGKLNGPSMNLKSRSGWGIAWPGGRGTSAEEYSDGGYELTGPEIEAGPRHDESFQAWVQRWTNDIASRHGVKVEVALEHEGPPPTGGGVEPTKRLWLEPTSAEEAHPARPVPPGAVSRALQGCTDKQAWGDHVWSGMAWDAKLNLRVLVVVDDRDPAPRIVEPLVASPYRSKGFAHNEVLEPGLALVTLPSALWAIRLDQASARLVRATCHALVGPAQLLPGGLVALLARKEFTEAAKTMPDTRRSDVEADRFLELGASDAMLEIWRRDPATGGYQIHDRQQVQEPRLLAAVAGGKVLVLSESDKTAFLACDGTRLVLIDEANEALLRVWDGGAGDTFVRDRWGEVYRLHNLESAWQGALDALA
jgi:hypothetical protein